MAPRNNWWMSISGAGTSGSGPTPPPPGAPSPTGAEIPIGSPSTIRITFDSSLEAIEEQDIVREWLYHYGFEVEASGSVNYWVMSASVSGNVLDLEVAQEFLYDDAPTVTYYASRGVLSGASASVSDFVVNPTNNLSSPSGTVYYFDATSGDDANDGLSSGSPKQTLDAANTLNPSSGDWVRFKGGETWDTASEGEYEPQDGITVARYGLSGRPLFDARTSGGRQASVMIEGSAGVGNRKSARLIGLEIENENTGFNRECVEVRYGIDVDVIGCVLRGGSNSFFARDEGDNILVRGNDFPEVGYNSNIYYQGHDSGTGGITDTTTKWNRTSGVVQNDTISFHSDGDSGTTGPGGALGAGHEVYGNVFRGGDEESVDCTSGSSLNFEKNWIIGGSGGGLMVCGWGATDVTINRNFFDGRDLYEGDTPSHGLRIWVSGVVVKNNVFVGGWPNTNTGVNNRAAVILYNVDQGAFEQAAKNVDVWNNTFYVLDNELASSLGGLAFEVRELSSITDKIEGVSWRNNLVYTESDREPVFFAYSAFAYDDAEIESSNNVYDLGASSASDPIADSSLSGVTLATAQGAGRETDSLLGSASFTGVDPGDPPDPTDYEIGAGSDAIDSGATIASVEVDFLGRTRSGTYDSGAFNYDGS